MMKISSDLTVMVKNTFIVINQEDDLPQKPFTRHASEPSLPTIKCIADEKQEGDFITIADYKGANEVSDDEPEAEPAKEQNADKVVSINIRSTSGQPRPVKQVSADKVFTVMMRNIPNSYTQRELLDELEGAFKGTFDFFYLPIDPITQANRGYAFINFPDPSDAARFEQTYEGCKLRSVKSKKVVSVTPAALQGFEANYRHYAGAWICRSADPTARPLFLREPTDDEKAHLSVDDESEATKMSVDPKASLMLELSKHLLQPQQRHTQQPQQPYEAGFPAQRMYGQPMQQLHEPATMGVLSSQPWSSIPLSAGFKTHQPQGFQQLKQYESLTAHATQCKSCNHCGQERYDFHAFCGFCGSTYSSSEPFTRDVMSTTPASAFRQYRCMSSQDSHCPNHGRPSIHVAASTVQWT
jgi:hypothetical protein